MLNAKFMEEKLKFGYTLDDFCEHLNVSQEDFLKALNQCFTTKAIRIFNSRMAQNAKKAKKSKSKSLKELSSMTITPVDEILDHSSIFIFTSSITSDDTSEVASEVTSNNTSEVASESLNVLKVKEADLIQKISDLELEHKNCVSERAKAKEELRPIQEKLEEIKATIRRYQEAIAEKIKILNQEGEKMAKINTSLSELRNELVTVQEQISQKSIFSVYIFNSEITFESTFDVEIPDQWEIIYDKIKGKDEFDEFTGKQLKNVSKAVAIKEKYGNDAQFIFDSIELEKIFDSLI